MTLDEAIEHEEELAKINQRVVDTGIVFDDVTIDMLYCDDTEVIEEHLANYQRCAEEHKQISEWLKELKRLKEQGTDSVFGTIYGILDKIRNEECIDSQEMLNVINECKSEKEDNK